LLASVQEPDNNNRVIELARVKARLLSSLAFTYIGKLYLHNRRDK